MREEKLAAIAGWLASKFPDCEIEQEEDFDRGAQSFKVLVPANSLLLKVSDEFIDDNSIDQIMHHFDAFAVAELIAAETGRVVLVTQEGIELFERD